MAYDFAPPCACYCCAMPTTAQLCCFTALSVIEYLISPVIRLVAASVLSFGIARPIFSSFSALKLVRPGLSCLFSAFQFTSPDTTLPSSVPSHGRVQQAGLERRLRIEQLFEIAGTETYIPMFNYISPTRAFLSCLLFKAVVASMLSPARPELCSHTTSCSSGKCDISRSVSSVIDSYSVVLDLRLRKEL